MFLSDNWEQYRILDTSGGEKLEDWNGHILIRPDPQIIWDTPRRHPLWRRAEGHYRRSATGGGHWDNRGMPESWLLR